MITGQTLRVYDNRYFHNDTVMAKTPFGVSIIIKDGYRQIKVMNAKRAPMTFAPEIARLVWYLPVFEVAAYRTSRSSFALPISWISQHVKGGKE